MNRPAWNLGAAVSARGPLFTAARREQVTLNLLGGVKPHRRNKPDETDAAALAAWEKAEQERRGAVRAGQRVLLLRYRTALRDGIRFTGRCGPRRGCCS